MHTHTHTRQPPILRRVYAYAAGGGEGEGAGESAKPAQNDFQARLAMFKQKETGAKAGGA